MSAAVTAPGGVPRPGPDVRGAMVVALYAAGWVGVLFVVNIVVVVLLFIPALQAGFTPDALKDTLADLMQMTRNGVPAWLLATTLAIQMPMMLGLAEGVRRLVSRQVWRDGELEGWREGYGWRAPSVAMTVAAMAMGFTTGWLPGWIASRLAEAWPGLSLGSMDLINKGLTSGGVLARGVVLAGIILGAPLVEELVFRGFMWRTLERSYGPIAAWIATSLMFAAYHMDPIQSTALVFTALVLGWVRLQSGSVIPGMALHFVNNSLGALGALYAVSDADLPLTTALVGAAITLAVCAALPRLPRT